MIFPAVARRAPAFKPLALAAACALCRPGAVLAKRPRTLAITALTAGEACDQATFDPVVDLPEGIAGPADDPIFAIRSPAYAVSLSRRGQ